MNIFGHTIGKHALAIAVAGAFLIAGCGGSKNPTSSNNNVPPQIHSAHFHEISIQNFAFSPASPSVAVGDTVNWTNNDGTAHTVTSDTGTELQSPAINPGRTYQHVFLAAGAFTYHCSIHTFMHGSVTAQ